ncbi:deoxynucleoside kinase [Abyssisolibacter fermentans]|uniref:deoxynucleoside kinase n=1 Tax=Abyssisolibacter fermentans TaxID=1766203 RepID=UPI00082B6FA6|nr:deoxynucleoside kinase [Abyssisolibacter fermentans]
MSKIIALCGIDGSGKSTYINYISTYFLSLNKSVHVADPMKNGIYNNSLRQGGSCKSSKVMYEKYTPELVSITYALDLLNSMNKIVNLNHDVIITHRHYLCCLACAELFTNNLDMIRKIISLVKRPDLIVYLDTDIEVAYSRIVKRAEELSIKEDKLNLMKCKKTYEKLIEQISTELVIVNTDRDITNNQFELKKLNMKINNIL